MKVELVCFSDLAANANCDYQKSTTHDMDEGQTVGDLIERAGILRQDVKIAMVNSRIANLETILAPGDRVGLAPAVGGM